ncbi:1,4-dihydroxy-6-naphthoate synthase [Dethiosulfatarculus sandiegensis]|uniref:1,4-dihydroxy-6-naphtoate synthase n=1 Tax=Dethiosulfatarculus sandiegensis TaxID=1429043 RepID=A0A0D2JPI0_9BACT|nr:1,4-dihydroxy-6-naphthoate synthase [Dethiosulfatarculus sandiegensis]KIX11390.1 1,4-dihydroxy-6-naphthoate synthase [Dethiosulfatarculus sandiegensis]
MSREITFGYSPCPNDTFAFHALSHGLVKAPGFKFKTRLGDVEELNRLALQSILEVTKLSFHALGHVLDKYALLNAGSALGRGCGPLVVAKPGAEPADLAKVKVAVPGRLTTAQMLLSLYLGKTPEVEPMEFSQVMEAVAQGRFKAGLVIHEGRFTYERLGLIRLLDLGEWWEAETGLPIPLGCIAMRRDLGKEAYGIIDRALGESVNMAMQHPLKSKEYVLAHAQEMEASVVESHIGLYVNDFTADLGEAGLKAVEEALIRGRQSGLLPQTDYPLRME